MTAAETARSIGLTERQLVTFHLGNEEFGADIMNVREIIRFAEVTKIPQAPDYVEGVCNLRGSILPIIDGRTRFGMAKGLHDENTRVLVVDVSGQVTGIVVDRVSEVLRVASADIEPPPVVIRSESVRYLDGVVKLNGGKRLIMALNLEQALTVESEGRDFDLQSAAAATVHEGAGQRAELEEDQLVTFLLGQEEYAFDIMHVKEIIRVPEITAVPNVLHYLEGVVSIRNHLLPIVNMRLYFGMANVPVTDQSRIIIVDLGHMTAGFRVDRVMEVIRVPKSVIEPPPPIFTNGELEQIRGVAKLNEGKRLFMCLNAANLLDADLVSELLEGGENSGGGEVRSNAGAIEEEQLVAFRLGKEEFAIQITDVQEINRMTQVTQMPGAPSYVEGLVNLRGNIIPALNLRRRFGMAERDHDDATRIIIVDVGQRKTGIIVDAVTEVLRFERSLVEETPRLLSETIEREYISGVAKLGEGKRMVMILDSERILKIEG
ncbi:chemotaxis protein [Heliobacterium gestii]|uniref:Chemotaxis protein n=1 Tax=Heliomicrobium gestii TaxID=2699 RepID=A0A845L641_HELGE|nr:chemotaxis protein CheW [Heliomicrobium gestii]MBM7865851.1 purine-binding chemotaxis protein CheW [Heliomicrobium gestii]MZP42092.1 chemotaxis protein [Heliomicrobium gestii]